MLFKILHGDASRLSTDITPFHEGYCYVSYDGGMYVDMNLGTKENPNNQRIQISELFIKQLLNITDDIGHLDAGRIIDDQGGEANG